MGACVCVTWATCKGGSACCSLCSANTYFDAMRTSMLAFWDATGMTVIDQDGAEIGQPCVRVLSLHAQWISVSVCSVVYRCVCVFCEIMWLCALFIGVFVCPDKCVCVLCLLYAALCVLCCSVYECAYVFCAALCMSVLACSGCSVYKCTCVLLC